MKNQDKHPIDNYFKDFMEQDFPYNPSSWKKATKVIDAYFGKRKKSILIVALILIAGSVVMFYGYDTKNKTVSKPIAIRQTNKEIKTKNNTSFYEVKTEIDNESVSGVKEEESFSKDNSAPESIGTPKHSENKTIEITKKTDDISDNENQNDIPISIMIEEPDTNPTKEKNTFFTDFVLPSKRLYSFNFNASNNKPQPRIIKTGTKKKFAIMLEVESLFLNHSKQKLGGLPQTEIDYRNKYESIKNTNTYHLNVMFQRANFDLITGLGYQNVIIKTDYLAHRVYYDTKILYKTENKSVPSSSGSYLLITTRVDTLGKKTEVMKIENQANQNQFEWLLVPVKISYQYPYKRFRFSVRTGVDLSWLYNARGAFINSDLKSVAIIDDKELNRFNATMSAQFMTGYQVNKRFQIGVSTYYNQQLGSNFKNYYSRFQNAGLGVYVRMGF